MPKAETTAFRTQRAFVPFLALAISILFLFVVKGFVVALLLAGIFATMTTPLYQRLKKLLGGRETLAAGLTAVVLIVAVLIPVLAFSMVLAREAAEVSTHAISWFQEIAANPDAARTWLQELPFGDVLREHEAAIIGKLGAITAGLGSWVARGLASASAGTIGFFLQVFVFLYAIVYFLARGEKTQAAVVSVLPLRPEDRTYLVNTFLGVSRATIKGTLIIGIVQGAMIGIGFAVLGLKGVFFWSAVAGVLSVIPGIGPALVYVPAGLLLVGTGRMGAGIGFVLYGAILVSNVDNVLRPRLVGKETAMPDLLVLVSTLGGLAYFGAPGIVLGPAIAGLFLVSWQIYRRTYRDVLEPDGQPAATP